MKKTLLILIPFVLMCLTALLIPGIQYGYFQGSMFNAGVFLGVLHILSSLAFVGLILFNIYSGIRNSR